MLLDTQKSLSLIVAISTTLLMSAAITALFTLEGSQVRLLIILLSMIFSWINITLMNFAKRIAPISHYYREATDQNFLFALLEKVKYEDGNPESNKKKSKEYPEIALYDVPLSHIQFVGMNSNDTRKRFFNSVLKAYPNARLIDLADSKNKMRLAAEISSRQATQPSKDEPLIVFSNDSKMNQKELESLGIFNYVLDDDLTTPISSKVIDSDVLRSFDPEHGLEDTDSSSFYLSKNSIKRLLWI